MDNSEDSFVIAEPHYPLWPYQKKAVDEVLTELRSDNRVLLHAPTGAGKTRMAMSAVSMWMRERDASMVLWLAPTKELVAQAALDFRKAWEHQGDVDAAVIQWYGGGEKFEYGTTIRRNTMLIAGLHMATQRVSLDSWIERSLHKRVGLVVFDEAHHAVARTYRQLVENIVSSDEAKLPLLGLTATPGRVAPEESKSLVEMYQNRRVEIGDGQNPIRFLVSHRYLSDVTITKHSFRSSNTPTKSDADYPSSVLSALGSDEIRNKKIVELSIELIHNGHKRIVAFTPSIDSALKCASIMREMGHNRSFAVSGQTSDYERTHYIRTFKTSTSDVGSPQVIFNCNLLTTGFDAPEISAAIIGRPTKSPVLLQQMIGRAIRGPKSGGTETAEVLLLADSSFIEFNNLSDLFCEWDSLWDPV